MSDLPEDPAVAKWIAKIDKPSTRKSYLQGMRDYTNYHNMSPTELLTEAIKDEIDKTPMFNRKICDRLDDFMTEIKKSGLADNTISGRITGIKSFYTKHRIEIPPDTEYRRQNQGVCKKVNKAIPDKEDIRDVLKHADELQRALILVGVSSGLSCNEIINLKLSDFTNGYDQATEITAFDLTRRKTGIDFITFISPEATRAVLDYIEYRSRWKKTITTKQRMQQLKKQAVYDDGYLFIRRHVPEKYLKTKDEELRKLTDNAVSKIYAELSDKSQKNTPSGAFNIIRSHNMRKYFNSALMNAGKVDPTYIEIWMGHKALSNLPSYFRHDTDKQRMLYKACVSDVTIAKELDITEMDEYHRMKDVIRQLTDENANFKMREGELTQLTANAERLAATLVDSIKAAEERRRIFENGSEAMGLTNYFSEEQIEKWKHDETHGYVKEEEETE